MTKWAFPLSVLMLLAFAPSIANAQQAQLRQSLESDAREQSEPRRSILPEPVDDDGNPLPDPATVFAQPVSNDGASSDGGLTELEPIDDPTESDRRRRRGERDRENRDDDPDRDRDVVTIDGAARTFDGLRDNDGRRLTVGNLRAQPAEQVGIIDASGQVTPLINTARPPEQGGALREREDDPYAALGIRRGAFVWFPSLTQTVGFTDNADFEADGESSLFSLTEAQLAFETDWSVHSLRGELNGSYQKFENGTSEDLPRVDGFAELRIDHTREFATTLGLRGAFVTESTESQALTVGTPGNVSDRPGVYTAEGYALAEKRTGRLTGSLRGTVRRTMFEDASLAGGQTVAQDDRTNTLFELAPRAAFEISPSLTPFAELVGGRRVFDEETNADGEQRSATVIGLRGGIEFERGEKITGRISAGYRSEIFDDERLEQLDGPTIDGSIVWSPERLTRVTGTVQTLFSPSSTAIESGSITYAGTLGIEREVRSNLTLNARVLASLREYQGIDRREEEYQAQIGAEYKLNRNLALTGELNYDIVESTDPDASYDAFSALIGLRLQR